MVQSLSALGTLKYGSYTFSAKSAVVDLVQEYKRDESGRVTTYTIHTLTVRDIIATYYQEGVGTVTAASQIATAERELSKQGQELIVRSHGIPDVDINGEESESDYTADIKFGPKPGRCRWRRLGGRDAWELTWSVEYARPIGCADPALFDSILAMNFRVTTSHDRLGYTTRTISGYVEISNNFTDTSATVVYDSVSDYIDDIFFPIPLNFGRGDRSFEITADKSRVNFSFTDSELPPNTPQPDVAFFNMRHSISSQGSTVMGQQWIGTLSGSYTMSRDVPRELSFVRFASVVGDRLGWLARNGRTFNPATGERKPIRKSIIPVGFTAEEDISGKESGRFSFTYSFSCSFDEVLKASGLWRPLPGSSYPLWISSMRNVMRNRGYAQIETEDDALVGLCLYQNTALRTGGLVPEERRLSTKSDGFPPPDPEERYMAGRVWTTVKAASNIARLKALPGDPQKMQEFKLKTSKLEDYQNDPAKSNLGTASARMTSIQDPQGGSDGSDKLQRRVTPSFDIYLQGWFLTAAYPPEIPVLADYNGELLTPAWSHLDGPEVVSNLGYPIFFTKFVQKYYLPSNKIEDYEIQPNPVERTSGFKRRAQLQTNGPYDWVDFYGHKVG